MKNIKKLSEDDLNRAILEFALARGLQLLPGETYDVHINVVAGSHWQRQEVTATVETATVE